VVGEAAEEYKRTDAARIAVTGHTDLSGSPAYNQALSERRAEAVLGELVWLGVPASVIGEGENDPLVPTAEGVREARNRRVEIEIPQPARSFDVSV
jgi:outer membrane protein OmpA-like peptidoglycan-associated protein